MKQYTDPVKAYLAEIGSRGGKARTAAKVAASKLNAKKGGAPKGNQNWKGRLSQK